MARLIDADKLHYIREWFEDSGKSEVVVFAKEIDEAPTVDAVPVIRCKDCIYWEEYCRIVDGVASDHVCSLKRELDGTMHRVKADDYCSWAERKEE